MGSRRRQTELTGSVICGINYQLPCYERRYQCLVAPAATAAAA
jgi:hypothetical protein